MSSSGDTTLHQPQSQRKYYKVSTMRVHDYLYDSSYIVSGAKDYARASFKAAMASAQIGIRPLYSTMFSELREYPRMQYVYYPNCRLPPHMDRSYNAYCMRAQVSQTMPPPQPASKDSYKYVTAPRKLLPLKKTSPRFRPPSSGRYSPTRAVNKKIQTMYRESSAQTHPWQPEGKAAECCEETPEVLYLDKLEWGPGIPYRTGDLPADFHTTEIINKMRHARKWMELVEKGVFPEWVKKRDAIIEDVETKDWIFREAEIDELQEIRLTILHKIQAQQRNKQTTKTSKKLAKLWQWKKEEMERKINKIHLSRDRELRKLNFKRSSGGRLGLVERMRSACGGGDVAGAAIDPTSDTCAPLARHGYQARRRHVDITYDPSLLVFEDHELLSKPPAWLDSCGQNLKKSCSGHHLRAEPGKLCERETKWSEQFLTNLHDELKKARLGAAGASAGPLRVLKPRRLVETPRPSTPEVEAVHEDDEACHQAALTLQRIVRGRAVQILMYEGRTRAAELTEELKTTHGLQKEDRARIAREEARARDYNALRTEAEQKDEAISALVDELCGGAVSAALDFLEKELRRLKEERRHHAFILIALREKSMREAAEAGRRQKELHRRREHDEMFRHVLGVTQETVDVYLRDVIAEGIEMAAEEDAVQMATAKADKVDDAYRKHGSMSTAETNEMVAELVQHFLLPEAHKAAGRSRMAALQAARLEAARNELFGLLDEAGIPKEFCIRCGEPLDELCRCRNCPHAQQPREMPQHREDPRWKLVKRPVTKPAKTLEERYPPEHELRCMLNTLVDEAVVKSREDRDVAFSIQYDYKQILREKVEVELDARDFVDDAFNLAMGVYRKPMKQADYKIVMKREIGDALERSQPQPQRICPKILPSEIRRALEEEARRLDPTCRCVEYPTVDDEGKPVQTIATMTAEERAQLLPSEVRVLEEMRRCKCDVSLASTPESFAEEMTSETTRTVSGEPLPRTPSPTETGD